MALRKKHAVQGGDAGRYVKVEKKKGTLLKSFHTQKQIWFLCLLALIWVVIFLLYSYGRKYRGVS